MNKHVKRVLVGLLATTALAVIISILAWIIYSVEHEPYLLGIPAIMGLIYFFGLVFE